MTALKCRALLRSSRTAATLGLGPRVVDPAFRRVACVSGSRFCQFSCDSRMDMLFSSWILAPLPKTSHETVWWGRRFRLPTNFLTLYVAADERTPRESLRSVLAYIFLRIPPVHALQLQVGQALSPANPYVLPQKASPLASRDHRGHLPLYYLAFGRLRPSDLTAASIQGPPISAGRAFLALDREVDKAAFGPVWLRDARVARVVADALLYGESGRQFYELRAWVIMPNHVHVLLRPKTSMPAITRWLKGSTARQANLILGRTGKAFLAR